MLIEIKTHWYFSTKLPMTEACVFHQYGATIEKSLVTISLKPCILADRMAPQLLAFSGADGPSDNLAPNNWRFWGPKPALGIVPGNRQAANNMISPKTVCSHKNLKASPLQDCLLWKVRVWTASCHVKLPADCLGHPEERKTTTWASLTLEKAASHASPFGNNVY